MKYLLSVLILSLFPLGIVYAAGGGLYVTPSSGVYRAGDTFDVDVFANTGGQAVTAVEAELAYNPSDFAIETISIEHSILTSWSTTPAYDGASGIIQFSGWAEKKYTGDKGLLITVRLRALRVAQSTLLFNSGAMLAADGRGTNIITTMTSGTYTIDPKQIVPTALPPEATSSTQDVPTSPVSNQPATQQSANPISAAAPTSQVAALLLSGAELGPPLIVFFAVLTLIAFGIAYVLHRKGVR